MPGNSTSCGAGKGVQLPRQAVAGGALVAVANGPRKTFETLCNVYLSEDSDKMAVQDSGLRSGTDRAQWFDEENPAFDLEEYKGTYYHPSLGGSRGQVLEVYESNKILYLQPSEDETYKLIPLQKDLFSYESPRFNFDVEIRFFRDSQGRVIYLNHYWKTAVRSGR